MGAPRPSRRWRAEGHRREVTVSKGGPPCSQQGGCVLGFHMGLWCRLPWPLPRDHEQPLQWPSDLRGGGTAQLRERPQSHPPQTLVPETHPLPGGADPSEGRGRVPRTGCSSASCPLVSWMPSRQAALGRKVAQLAGQVCLSSNRTQEEAPGVLTPSCWPGRRHLQRWAGGLPAGSPQEVRIEGPCWGPTPTLQ